MKKVLLLCTFIFLGACASKHAVVSDLETDGREWTSQVATLNEQNCEGGLDQMLASVHDYGARTLAQPETLQQQIGSNPRAQLNHLFQLRMRAKNKLVELYRQNSLSDSCLDGLTNINEALRALEENFGHQLYPQITTAEPQPVFSNSQIQLYSNESLHSTPLTSVSDLQDGDILVSREAVPLRSVAAIVHRNEHGDLVTIIFSEKKSQVQPIHEWLAKEMSRAGVYRFHDEMVAQGAAAAAYQMVSEKGELEADFLQNAFSLGEKDSAMSDVENDPRFKLLTEWKDYSVVTQSHPENYLRSQQPVQADTFWRNLPIVIQARDACFLVN